VNVSKFAHEFRMAIFKEHFGTENNDEILDAGSDQLF